MPQTPPAPRRLRLRPRGAGLLEYGVLVSLIALAAVGAVMLTGERTRGTLASADLAIAAAPPPPGGGGSGSPSIPPGTGAWSDDGTFLLVAENGPEGRVFVLANVGQGPLALGTPAVSGPGAGLPFVALTATASGFAPLLSWTGTGTFVLDGALGAGPMPRTAERTLMLANDGTLAATSLSIGVSGAGFSLASTTCMTALPAVASCTATVAATAAGNGAFSRTLSSGGPASAT